MVTKKGFFLSIRLLTAFGILYYLLSKVPLSQVIYSIYSADVGYVVYACIVSILIQIILAYRLKFLADRQEMSLSASQLLEVNLTTVFYGLFLPGGNLASGAIRFYRLSKPENKRAQALTMVVFDRMVATITVCLTGVVFWLIDLPPDSVRTGLSLAIALGGLSLLYVFLFERRASLLFQKFFHTINFPVPREKVDKLILSFRLYQNLSWKDLTFVFTLSIVTQILGIFVYYLLALSLGVDILYITMGWIRSAIMIVTIIPISISGIGVREGILLFLLKPYGVSGEESIALSFLIFGVSLLFIGAIGGILEGWNLLFPGKGKPYVV